MPGATIPPNAVAAVGAESTVEGREDDAVTVVEGILPWLNMEAVVLVLDVMVESSTFVDFIASKLTLKPLVVVS